ncbi:MAG TPA: hypothetical protein EYP71_00040 [Dehalococcoidia bacterium]|nr:hypothetical protein [Dehalococcoidia bacterium]
MVVMTKGYRELITDVIDAGLCTLCGACTATCPYLVCHKGRIAVLDNCTLSEGKCYKYCPRTHTDMDALSRRIFGTPYGDSEIGTAKDIFMARTTDKHISKRSQYGGTVTTLLSLALTEGLVDCVVLSKTSDDRTIHPFLAKTTGEIFQCAGSNYMACPVLASYNQVSKHNDTKLAIVGTPCQVLAATKMKLDSPTNRTDAGNVKLVIGLFCTWALSPNTFHRFLQEKVDLSKVTKFDIPPPPADSFDIYTTSGKTSISLDEVRKFTMPACTYCLDMTSEFADISVGSVEGVQDWNTVIVRTDVGAELVKLALNRGGLKTEKLPPANLAHLREAALLKKKQALKEIVARSGDRNDFLYIILPPELAQKLQD